jgi:hypothetical protein
LRASVGTIKRVFDSVDERCKYEDNYITLHFTYFNENHSYVPLDIYANVLIRTETNSEKSEFTELKNKDGYQDGASLFSPFQTAAGRPTLFSVVKQTLEKKTQN